MEGRNCGPVWTDRVPHCRSTKLKYLSLDFLCMGHSGHLRRVWHCGSIWSRQPLWNPINASARHCWTLPRLLLDPTTVFHVQNHEMGAACQRECTVAISVELTAAPETMALSSESSPRAVHESQWSAAASKKPSDLVEQRVLVVVSNAPGSIDGSGLVRVCPPGSARTELRKQRCFRRPD